jgi:hypothetical protein
MKPFFCVNIDTCRPVLQSQVTTVSHNLYRNLIASTILTGRLVACPVIHTCNRYMLLLIDSIFAKMLSLILFSGRRWREGADDMGVEVIFTHVHTRGIT